jgi:hypothetical protein
VKLGLIEIFRSTMPYHNFNATTKPPVRRTVRRWIAIPALLALSGILYQAWYASDVDSYSMEGVNPVTSVRIKKYRDTLTEAFFIYNDEPGVIIDISPLTGFTPMWTAKEARLNMGPPDRSFRPRGSRLINYAYKRPGGEVCLVKGPGEGKYELWYLKWRPEITSPESLLLDPELLRQVVALTPSDRFIDVGLYNEVTGLNVTVRMNKYKVHDLTLWSWGSEEPSSPTTQSP